MPPMKEASLLLSLYALTLLLETVSDFEFCLLPLSSKKCFVLLKIDRCCCCCFPLVLAAFDGGGWAESAAGVGRL